MTCLFDDSQAGLFSVVNTACISAAMPALASAPSDRTDVLLELLVLCVDNNTLGPVNPLPLSPLRAAPSQLIVCSMLVYSAASSLISAVGAMLAKE